MNNPGCLGSVLILGTALVALSAAATVGDYVLSGEDVSGDPRGAMVLLVVLGLAVWALFHWTRD